MIRVFVLTQFTSAFLIFLIQPIVGKMALPVLGGSPAVWISCMLFFQATLLGGYAYAHLSSRLGLRRQVFCHLALLLIAGAVLPFELTEKSAALVGLQPWGTLPVLWVVVSLSLTVGLPFFVLAGSGPMLQHWFASTAHKDARDPYFLYSASNLGSLLALMAYPTVVEPFFRLRHQSFGWAIGYGVLCALLIACAVALRNGMREASMGGEEIRAQSGSEESENGGRQRLIWIALSFGPSSLMLGVTNYLTTDIASVPLFWMVPLMLYLLTFALAFARRSYMPHAWLVRALPALALLLVLALLWEATRPTWVLIPLHLLTFFVAATVCHGELARRRPATNRLTEFYLCISAGGVLGGILNAAIAPNVFTDIIEYPLALVVCCCLCPARKTSSNSESVQFSKSDRNDILFPALLGVATVAFILAVQASSNQPGAVLRRLVYALPAVVCYSFVSRPLRFGLALGALYLSSHFYVGYHGRTIHQERNFFGVLRVTEAGDGKFRKLVHGNTLHGQRFIEPDRADEPLAYYHHSGPMGRAFQALGQNVARAEVGIVGLGVGALAHYAKDDQEWRYFEIDPAVQRIAETESLFVFLRNSKAAQLEVVIGDARLRLKEMEDSRYDFLLVDAFSSDAIPMHLVTRESIQLYVSRLKPAGLLMFHISNRYLDLAPILKTLADDAGLRFLLRQDNDTHTAQIHEGKAGSVCAVMYRQESDVAWLRRSDALWREYETTRDYRVWTDDYSDILSILQW